MSRTPSAVARRLTPALGAGILMCLVGCSASAADPATVDGSTRGAAGGSAVSTGTVTMLAAASLTEPLTTLATAYEAAAPGVDISLSFGSSTTLAQQVRQGAPADLVAFAGDAAVDQLPEQYRAPGRQTRLARNVLEIATPEDNAKEVGVLADLSRGDVLVVLCVETAPCGAAADRMLERAGVPANVVSREIDVKATLAKVRLGEVDAAIVYHSDVVSARGSVTGVTIPADQNTTLDYPLVRLTETPAAQGFAAFVTGPEGLRVLTASGFLAP